MKKFLAVAMILMFSFSFLYGCGGCKRQQPDGTYTTTVANCTKPVVDYVCNPTAAVKKVANAAAPVLLSLLAGFIPGTAPFIAMAQAAATAQSLTVVDAAGKALCVTSTELANLINVLQSPKVLEAQAATAKSFDKSAKARAVAQIDVQPLINWGATANIK